jgi:hypothetical protein
VFEGKDAFGAWSTQPDHFPRFVYHPEVNDFVRTLYAQGILYVCDWKRWGEEAERYQSHPDLLKAADLLTLRKLLTLHVRADRFVEGHLASVLESGHITAILWRMKHFFDEMTKGGTSF